MNQGAGVGHRSASARDALLAPVARELIDEILQPHARAIGRDLGAYRHHVYRVAAFCSALAPHDLPKIAIAAAFHDLGIWTHGTFDYLQPSIDLCGAYLDATARSAWTPELTTMIREHHKISPYTDNADWLVEPFRRADWIDVTRGVLSHGVSRGIRARVFAEWPSLGFRRRLLAFTLQRWRQHPLSPLPMVRL